MSDLIKRRFGRLTVVEFYGIHTTPCGSKRRMWRCVCDCGNEVIASTSQLNSGNTKSCGCYKYEKMRESRTKHNGTHDRLYLVWKNIKRRCNNPNDKSYKYYGGTGIKMCDEWEHDYSAFKEWAYKNGYDENAELMKCTIDRIDPYKDYMPSNCRWVDMFEQNKDSHKRKGLQVCT